jgi:hypothetical protein
MVSATATEAAAPQPEPVAIPRVRHRLDPFEVGVFALFAAISLWVLSLDLYQVIAHGRSWTGTDGLFLADQMQYLAWIQDASRHFLASDLFVIRGTSHDYFQPVVIISGALTAAGVAPWLSLLLWKPVAVVTAFIGVRAYAHRTFPERFDRRATIALALFFGSAGIIGDEWLPFWSWGYPFGLLAVAALLGALLSYDRARARDGFTWIAPLLGAIASFTHPWQGELFVLIVIGAELLRWDRGAALTRRLLLARLRLPLVTLIFTGVPLLYYELLDKTDPVWKAAGAGLKHDYSLWALILPVLPLLVPALFAYRRRLHSWLDAATRVWPLAALAMYELTEIGFAGAPLHTFAGITIPLALLAVEGARRIGLRRLPAWRWLAALLVAAGTIPATVFELRTTAEFMEPVGGNANFISGGEQSALNYLASNPTPGGVLVRAYMGVIVPAQTGRHTYVGSCVWSEPRCSPRVTTTVKLMKGLLSPAQARSFVVSTGARFLLQDCRSHGDLDKLLGPIVSSTRRFGCAAVYEVSS